MKKIICLLLVCFCFILNVHAEEKYLYFLVNCEESRNKYKELTGKELTESGGYWIDVDDLDGELANDSSSDSKCGPSTTGKLACSFGCVEEAIDNVSSGNVVKTETIEELFDVLGDAGIFTTNGDNPYCKVASSESKKFSAPLDNSVKVQQGSRFEWLNNSGHVLSLNYVKEYLLYFDYDLWKKDYNNALNTFNEVNSEYIKNKTTINNNKWVAKYDDYYTATSVYSCPVNYSSMATDKTKCVKNGNGLSGGRDSIVDAKVTYSCEKNSNLYELKGKICFFKYSKENYNNAIKERDELLKKRNEAVKKIKDLIAKAKGCSSVSIPDYKACTDVTISYDDEVYGNVLREDKDYSKLYLVGSSNVKTSNSSLINESIKYYECTDDSCRTMYENVSFYKTKNITYEGNYDWDLKSDMFKCVGIDGYSYLRCDIAENKLAGSNNYFGKYKNYVTLEKPNFPVNFNSKEGKHNITINYGCKDASTGEVCHYNVVSCVGDKCDDKGNIDGLDVIYRVISLSNPFPNRNPGANWDVNNYVNDYITNNRKVNTDEVYTKEPMYEIELTPKLINDIRSSNKEVNYGDLNKLYCNEGEECRSEFLKELNDNGYLKGCGTSTKFNECKVGDV